MTKDLGVQDLRILIKNLSQKSIFPSLNGERLFDLLENRSLDIYQFIKENSILSNKEDIYSIINSKYLFEQNKEKNRDLLKIYNVVFDKSKKSDPKIVIFSGGRGAKNIIKGFRDQDYNDLNIVINAYDDGKSTGDIRQKFDILGPSDIMKNLIHLMNNENKDLKFFLEYRFHIQKSKKELKKELKDLIFLKKSNSFLNRLSFKISRKQRVFLGKFLQKFYEIMLEWEKKNGEDYDLRDYALRNIVFVGAYFYYDKGYQFTITKLLEIFQIPGKILIPHQESFHLIAITEDCLLLNSEREIVEKFLEKEIEKIFIVQRKLNEKEVNLFNSFHSKREKISYLYDNFCVPLRIDEESLRIIKSSDLIIFSPSTFYSSLIPTLIPKEIKRAINESQALKIFIPNLVRERGDKLTSEYLDSLLETLYLDKINNQKSLDYIILNSSGFDTRGIPFKKRIPIDENNLFQRDINVIKLNLESKIFLGEHHPSSTCNSLISLKEIESLGYVIKKNKLIKKNLILQKKNDKDRLESLLRNPFLFHKKEKLIEEIILKNFQLDKIEDFKPIKPVRVVILGAGKSTRLNSNIPKILYPINKRANLFHLLKKYTLVDEKPIVVLNKFDYPYFKKWNESENQFPIKSVISENLGGTAKTFAEIVKKELDNFEGDVLLSWGDISNITLKSIFLVLAIHQFLNTSVTIPTCVEKDPYAFFIRNSEGEIKDFFLKDEKSIKFGEHDASFFILNLKKIKEYIPDFIEKSNSISKLKETNLLSFFPYLKSKNEEVLGVSCVHFKECQGFNNINEKRLVEKYMDDILKENLPEKGLLSIHFDIPESFIKSEKNNKNKFNSPSMKNLFSDYLKRNYKGLLIDFDGTMTSEKGILSEKMVEKIIQLANNGIPIGIVTGRTNYSLNQRLISKIISSPRIKDPSIKNFYIYPENGTYCYNLKEPNKKLYDSKISWFFLETAFEYLRKYIFCFEDHYSMTDYKIHLWPKKIDNLIDLVKKINFMFKKLELPMKAYKSSEDSLLILEEKMNKGYSLKHFSNLNNLKMNDICKIGDMSEKMGIDYPLLKGKGSFSVNNFCSESKSQINLPLLKGKRYEGHLGTIWLLNNLKFINYKKILTG